METHLFRPTDETKNISPEKFRVKLKYMTPQERLDAAVHESSQLLSTGEKISQRPPFEFRAHEPLRSNYKGFQFKHLTEQDRMKDKLRNQQYFETAAFDNFQMVNVNKHRNQDKSKWLTTERGGFTVPAKVPDGANTTRSAFLPIEPYEDPNP